MSHLLNLDSGSLTDNLSGRGNYHVNLSLGPGVDPSNYEDTFVITNISPLFPGDLGVVVADDWCIRLKDILS